MQGEEKARRLELCEQASTEQDPNQLSELAKEIDCLLQEKQGRLKARSWRGLFFVPLGLVLTGCGFNLGAYFLDVAMQRSK
jgi:hypothetical protein